LAWLAKLPSCTAQARPAIDVFAEAEMGAGAAVSSDPDPGDAGLAGGAEADVSECVFAEGWLSAEDCVSAGGVLPPVPVPVPVLPSAPTTALAASALPASGAGWALDAAASAGGGSGSGALLVARSTVTLRTGSGALTGSRAPMGAGAGCGGPDNSSGTINTMSTTKIDAPTRRSLTRRSIELSLERE
jgi:hypothetical protein